MRKRKKKVEDVSSTPMEVLLPWKSQQRMKELGGKRQITIGEAGPDRSSTAPPEPAAESWGTSGDS